MLLNSRSILSSSTYRLAWPVLNLFHSTGTGQISNYPRRDQSDSSSSQGRHKSNFKKNYINVSGGPKVRGIGLLRDPQINKGTAFTLKERQILGIHGLLPPVVFTQEEQADKIIANFRRCATDLDKFIYLSSLMDRNEKLFYQVISRNIEEMVPIIYTPTVGRACHDYGFIFRKPRGLYITINDIGHVYDILCNWPETQIKVIVVTDGERILGLGDLGAYGMGIPVGKLSLYTALGGVPPKNCLPVVLDVGTDNEELLEDPVYIGLRHKRVRGHQYDALIDEFMDAVVQRFERNTLVQFEDFANHNAFRLLRKYRHDYLTFNDDIQGTAAVAVAGVIAAVNRTKAKLSDQIYLFQGAGEAAIGIANLLVMAMVEEGSTKEEAVSRIWMADIKGLVTKNRSSGGITSNMAVYAKDYKESRNLEIICEELKPTVAIGASTASGSFTEKFLQTMAKNSPKPIIFALSNPTDKAECTAEQAYKFTKGTCIFATGSPFDPVEYEGKMLHPSQCNNAYIFPGMGLGAISSGICNITDEMFLIAAHALADMVSEEDFEKGRVFPPLCDVQEVSTKLAVKIVEHAYKLNIAEVHPEPKDKVAFVRAHQYCSDYESYIPVTYPWPGMNN